MRLPDDDEIYDVDMTYLGPPGYYIARLRLRVVMTVPVLAALGALLLYRTGIGFSLLSVGIGLAVVVRLSVWIADHASRERPVSVLAATLWHELGAVRRPRKGFRSTTTNAFRRRRSDLGAQHVLVATGRRLRWRSYANEAASIRAVES